MLIKKNIAPIKANKQLIIKALHNNKPSTQPPRNSHNTAGDLFMKTSFIFVKS